MLLPEPRPQFTSSPSQTLKIRGGRAGRRERPFGSRNLPLLSCNAPFLLFLEKENFGPQEGVGDSDLSGRPKSSLALVSAPGGFTFRPPPLTPVPTRKLDVLRCGSRPRPARNRRRRSLPGVTLAAQAVGGGPISPPSPHRPAEQQRGLGPRVAAGSLQAREPTSRGHWLPARVTCLRSAATGAGRGGRPDGNQKARPAGSLSEGNQEYRERVRSPSPPLPRPAAERLRQYWLLPPPALRLQRTNPVDSEDLKQGWVGAAKKKRNVALSASQSDRKTIGRR